jgi:hypothetical protein
MGTGTYIGSHTKIFISARGTKWEVPDNTGSGPDNATRDRRDDEVGVETGRGLRRVSKEGRSFLSMCAVAFHTDVLSETHPKPPGRLQREIKLAGGNKKWIVSDTVRLALFEQFFKKAASKRLE